MKTVRFMLLEKLTQDREEPDFHPKYKKVTPPGLGQRQTTSIGVGQGQGSNFSAMFYSEIFRGKIPYFYCKCPLHCKCAL